MEYENYIFQIRKDGRDVSANKHCPDDDAAMRLARSMQRTHSGATISVYHITEVEGREFKNYIGMVK